MHRTGIEFGLILVFLSTVAFCQSERPSIQNNSVTMHSDNKNLPEPEQLTWHNGEIQDAVFLGNGHLVTLSPTGKLLIWDPDNGVLIQSIPATEPKTIKLLLSSNGRQLLGLTRQGVIQQWDLPAPKRPWGPEQMLGKPDTRVGDLPTAWASASTDDQAEWVLLQYESAVLPQAIHVYENENPGALIRAAAVADDGKEAVLWEGKDPVGECDGLNIAKLKISPANPFRRLKLYIDSKSVPGWNEIDAVGLEEESGQIHWASSAGASSSFADRLRTPGGRPSVSTSVPAPTYQVPEGSITLTHVDDTAEAKQSLGGSGHAIQFQRGANQTHIAAIDVFGSRYGRYQPPEEQFTVYILDQNQNVIRELEFPYAVFQRGREKWNTLSFEPVPVPAEFFIGDDFHAHQALQQSENRSLGCERRHFAHRPNNGREFHLVNDVSLHVNSRGDFDEFQSFRLKSENRTLGDKQDIATGVSGDGATEGNLFNLSHKLWNPTFVDDSEFSTFVNHFQAVCCECSTEHKSPCVLRDIDEAANSGKSSPEFRDVHISMLIDLGGSQCCEVETSAVVEVKLRRLIDDGFRKAGCTKAESTGWNTANRTAFHGERHVRQQSAFRSDDGNSLR